MKNYYDILGLKRNASKEDVKHAYRNLAFKYHPDRNKDEDQEERFNDINEAKQVLLDDLKRAHYDEATEKKGLTQNILKTLSFSTTRQKGFKSYSGQERYFKNSRVQKKPVYVFILIAFLSLTAFMFLAQHESEPAAIAYSNEEPVQIPTDISNSKNDTAALLPNNPDTSTSKTNDGLAATEKANQREMVQQDLVAEARATPKKQEAVVKKTIAKDNSLLQKSKPAVKKEALIARQTEIKKHRVLPATANTEKITVAKTPVNNPEPSATTEEPIAEKQMSQQDMSLILNDINNEKTRLHNRTHCVQIRKTTTSNAANGFKLAEFLRSNGFIISGRETVSGNSNGVKIEANDGCVRVTIGII